VHRRAHTPPPEASLELVLPDLDPGALGGHAEQSSQPPIRGVEPEGKAGGRVISQNLCAY
jgi:hypothetical protein